MYVMNTVDSKMLARTSFSLIFVNSLPREFKVLILKTAILDSILISNIGLRIQELAKNSEMKN